MISQTQFQQLRTQLSKLVLDLEAPIVVNGQPAYADYEVNWFKEYAIYEVEFRLPALYWNKANHEKIIRVFLQNGVARDSIIESPISNDTAFYKVFVEVAR